MKRIWTEKVEAVLKALKLDRSSTVKHIRRIKSKGSSDNQSNKELDRGGV